MAWPALPPSPIGPNYSLSVSDVDGLIYSDHCPDRTHSRAIADALTLARKCSPDRTVKVLEWRRGHAPRIVATYPGMKRA